MNGTALVSELWSFSGSLWVFSFICGWFSTERERTSCTNLNTAAPWMSENRSGLSTMCLFLLPHENTLILLVPYLLVQCPSVNIPDCNTATKAQSKPDQVTDGWIVSLLSWCLILGKSVSSLRFSAVKSSSQWTSCCRSCRKRSNTSDQWSNVSFT